MKKDVTLIKLTMSYRQFRGGMLTTYQILNGFIDVDITELFNLSTSTQTRGYSMLRYA